MSIVLSELTAYCNKLLEVQRFQDYCPNGLQVEGRHSINTIVSGVTASLSFIEAALKVNADALLVHHGYFWRGEHGCLVGMQRRRMATLMQHNLSLLAYHLPLDAHDTFGNNAQLGALLGFTSTTALQPQHPQGLGMVGKLPELMSTTALAAHISACLQRDPLVIAPRERIESIAWCTGAAQDFIADAYDCGVDAYLSGEISERTVHFARETGTTYFAAGHHATERYGVQALGAHLGAHFGIEHHFIDIDNPV